MNRKVINVLALQLDTLATGSSSVRNLFPGLQNVTYLDTAARSPMSILGKQAADGYLSEAFVGGDKKAMFACIERVRALYAKLLGAEAAEIAITKNVSEGLNIIAHSIDWKAGDNIVVCTAIEHPNNVYVWYHAARLYGLEVRALPAADFVVRPEEVAKLVDGRTRVCAVAAQSFVPGYVTDLDSLGSICREKGTALVVDAAQAAGVMALDVNRLGITAMATSTQKGLLGTYGMGFLYVRRDFCDVLSPRCLARFGVLVESEHEADLGSLDGIRFAEGATRFDLGNYNFLGAAIVEPGLKLIGDIGISAVEKHNRRIARLLAEGLNDLGLPVMGMPGGSHLGTIITVGRPGAEPSEAERLTSLARHLAESKVKFSERRSFLRFAVHLYNEEADVNRILDLVSGWKGRGATR